MRYQMTKIVIQKYLAIKAMTKLSCQMREAYVKMQRLSWSDCRRIQGADAVGIR